MALSTRRPDRTVVDDRPVESGLLIVCTGNVCRSAFAEAVLRHALRGEGHEGVEVRSAGTAALTGEAMDPLTSRLCEERGVGHRQHRARQLERSHARDADLILTATREHRRHVVQLEPRAVRYTFTIRQAGRLLASLQQGEAPSVATAGRSDRVDEISTGPVDLRTLRDAMARQRGAIGPINDPAEDDVLDPRGRSMGDHRESVRQMMPALRLLAASVISLTARA